ncbi:hypothetical protein FIBSPDRAFT_430859 [Athelia psychrophila]|uniref:DUF6589 domain-containing protein n=1 Tax=Athelia psychrophila TaxID=1759441 RepID=A0A166MM19_9AGAM|nr:hypothetical protein FIBSPDRAFT_430859 [Fibularhizoctonia sp. CBS 109695]
MRYLLQDLMPDSDQRASIFHQSMILAVRALVEHEPKLKHFKDDPLLQFKPRRPLPKDYRTEHVTVHTVTGKHTPDLYKKLIGEAYTAELEIDATAAFEHRAIPSVNSLVVNTAIRQAQMPIIRKPKPWTPEEHALMALQLGPGLLDILKIFVKSTLDAHKGNDDQSGSFATTFNVLDKAHLLAGKPKDFYNLLSTMETIIMAGFLDMWRINCGFPSTDAFADSHPTAQDILDIARTIIVEHAERIVPRDSSFEDDEQYSGRYSDAELEGDTVFANARIQLAALLRIFILKYAIQDADVGRIEDILGSVCICLLGAGNDSASEEIFRFLQGVKHIWPEPFANIMRDSLVLNLFRASENSQAADVSKEDLSRYIKVYLSDENDLPRKPTSLENAVQIIDGIDLHRIFAASRVVSSGPH